MKKVKKKRKTRRLIIGILILCIFVGGILLNLNRIELRIKGYDRSDTQLILSLEDYQIDEILDYDSIIHFSKWNKVKNNQNYIYYDKYYKENKQSVKKVVSYVDDYVKLKKKLDHLGYTTNIVFKNSEVYSIENLRSLMQQKIKYKTAKKYLKIDGVQICDLSKYEQSKLKPLQAILSISYPMIDSVNASDRVYEIEEPNTLVLIKKGFVVRSDYVPSSLREVNIPYESQQGQMQDEAATALEEMYADVKKEGYELTIKSSYRSYADQEAIYNEYFSMYDADYAASLVNTPGSSEHQLGLSVDLTSSDVIDGTYSTFGQTPAYQWVEKNAYKYGYILRYPENKSSQTGATNEPWHFRYVGKKAAKEIYEKNWTLEDYILNHGFTYEMKIQ